MRPLASLRVVRRQPLAAIGGGWLLLLGAVALAAPVLTPHALADTFLPMMPPTARHPLGTNDLGYDLATELLFGARRSLALGLCAALAGTSIGLIVGAIAGFWPQAGNVLMRLVDAFLAVPRFPLIILLAAFTRPGFTTLLLFFTLFGWPTVARIVYARLRSEREAEYVSAARAVGVPESKLLIVHVLPASLPVAFTRLVSEMQHVIMAEAGLSFLGLGDPTLRTWGMTLSHATRYPALLLTDVWLWWALPPGLAITSTCLALVLLGLVLDRVANPRIG